MKKKILTGLFLLSIALANAQENKNKFVVNANLGISNGNNNTLGLGGFNIGYFLTNEVSIGITGNYNNSSRSSHYENIYSNATTRSKRSENFVGTFVRYNFVPKNKFSFFLSLTNSYTNYRFKDQYIQININNGSEELVTADGFSKGYTLSLIPGIVYYIIPKFSAEITFGSVFYRTEQQKGDNYAGSVKNSGVGSDLFTSALNIGISYYFNCKGKNQDQ